MSLVGRLEDLALPDIFQIISLSKKTGTLIARSRKGTGIVVFKDGQVIQAGHDSIRDSLGNILVSQGMLSESALTQALALQKNESDKPLGLILVEMGEVSRDTLEEVIRKQIEEIVYDLLGWEEGFFNFELGEVSPTEKIPISSPDIPLQSGISAEYLLMEGSRVIDEKRQSGSSRPAPAFSVLNRDVPPRVSSEPVKQEFKTRIEKEEPRKDIAALKAMFDELRFPTATAEVTLLILRYASEVVNRAILFMVKKDEVRGLGQFGIDLVGKSADHVVRNITISLHEPSLFQRVIENRSTFIGKLEKSALNNYFMNELGGVMPDQVLAIPLVVDGKIALIVYGDNLPAQRPIQGVETLEIFMNQAGMALEKALLEKRLAELQREKR
ncbi:MAG: DUF4388 domain-containing protein [Nitrospirota bacterium]